MILVIYKSDTMKKQYYVVWDGRVTGVYSNWSDAEAQVKGYSNGKYAGFTTKAEAENAYKEGYTKWLNAQSNFLQDRPPLY
jgi:ribonuclease HI